MVTEQKEVKETKTSKTRKISIPLEDWEKGRANVKALLKDVPDFEGRKVEVIEKGKSKKGNPWLLCDVEGVDTPIVFPMGDLTTWDRMSESTSYPIFKAIDGEVVVDTDSLSQWVIDNDGGNASIRLK
ncbi:MAG TPA: hypothetical protein VJ962_12650 [Clostridia bacterium]|nr:hypothetical protein [Clostridia bacterium]